MGRKGKKLVYKPCQELTDHMNKIGELLDNPSGFDLRIKEAKCQDATTSSKCHKKVNKFLVPSRHPFYSYPPVNMPSPAQILQDKDTERANYLETYCMNKMDNKINIKDTSDSNDIVTMEPITLKDIAAKLAC